MRKLFLAACFLVPATGLALDPVPPPAVKKVKAVAVVVPPTLVGPAREVLRLDLKNPDKVDVTVVSQTPVDRLQWFRECTDDPAVFTVRVFGRVEGEYVLTYYTAVENRVVKLGDTLVTVGNPTPVPPKPGPKPDPDPPKPAPAESKLFVIVIEETADGAATRGAMFADAALGARMKEKGHRWRIADQNVKSPDNKTPPKDLEGYLKAAAGKPLPYMFLVTPDADLRFEGPLPTTGSAAFVLDQLKKHGG